MHKFQHAKNTVRYYILIVFLLAFLFVSNDFGLIDVQKPLSLWRQGSIGKKTLLSLLRK